MKKRLVFFFFLGLLSMQACQPDPYLTVAPDSLDFSQDGGSQTVRISANYPWTAAVSGSGFSVSPASGEGEMTVTVKADAAKSADPVAGTLTVRSEGLSASVSLKQDAKSTIRIGKAVTIPAEGGTYSVDIQYNTEYTVEVGADAKSWITFNGTKALQSGKLEFLFAANDGTDPRTGTVTVKDKSGKAAPVTITFTQEEKKVVNVGEVATVSEKGGTVEVDIQYNTDFSVVIDGPASEWLSFVKTKSLQTGKLEFLVAANDFGDVREGKAFIRSADGKQTLQTLVFKQESRMRRLLTEFYLAMDGPAWKQRSGWCTDAELRNWAGVGFDEKKGVTSLVFNGFGLKGEIPAVIGEFTGMIRFRLTDEPGVTGVLPPSFAQLTNLVDLMIHQTSMTSLPDVFAGMTQLGFLDIFMNQEMTGPLPESIGSLENLQRVAIEWNSFTGTVPASWIRHIRNMSLWANHLSGPVPETFLQGTHDEVAYALTQILMQQEGYGFDISDIDIPGYWPKEAITDIVTGKTFTFSDVVKKNKYTVYLSWAPWCPFSKGLMPQLLDYYDKYRDAGLEIIATQMLPEDQGSFHDGNDRPEEEAVLLRTILEKGYDKWYNFYYSTIAQMAYPASTPQAEVYDRQGNLLFSSFFKYPGPDSRKRYGYAASVDLIPFLESLLGPAEIPDSYTSVDYSKDGEVMTLQTATTGKGINIVFLGDAYTDRDMDKDGRYETVMRQAMEEFFSIEPYKTYRNRFNVFSVKVVSPNGKVGEGNVTALGTTFGNGTSTSGNVDKCYEYALKVPGISGTENLLISVMVNTLRHAGTAVMSESLQSSVAFTSTMGNDPESFGPILRHEAAGHGFGFLADEYTVYQAAAPKETADEYNRLYNAYGWFANADFTNDPAEIHWSAFLSDDRYKNEVGVFEGCALYSLGAYRPSANSMMNENFEYFNAPSRWAIYQRIMQLSGEECSFEKFLEYDAVNRGKAASSAPGARSSYRPTTPPTVVR